MASVTVVHPRGETTRSVSSLAELNAYVINRGWGLLSGAYPDAYQTITGQPYTSGTAAGAASGTDATVAGLVDDAGSLTRTRLAATFVSGTSLQAFPDGGELARANAGTTSPTTPTTVAGRLDASALYLNGAPAGVAPASLYLPAAQGVAVAGTPTLAVNRNAAAWLFDADVVESVGWYLDRLPAEWATFDIYALVVNPVASTGVASFTIASAWSTDAGALADVTDLATSKPATFTGAQWQQVFRNFTIGTAVTPNSGLSLVLRRAATAGADTLPNDAAVRGLRLVRTNPYPTSADQVVRNGRTYNVQTPAQPWSMVLTPGYDRFELRSGDQWASDPAGTKNRSELRDTGNVTFGTPCWQAFSVRVPAANVFPADEVLFGQWHPDFGTPDLAYKLMGTTGTLMISSRSNPAVGGEVVYYNGPPLKRDVWHHFVARLVFADTTSTGSCEVWLNGTKIVNLAGIPLGAIQPGGNTTGPYWKYGNYRNWSTPTSIFEHCNQELTTADLSARITNPLPCP